MSVTDAQSRINRLTLLCQAMWELMTAELQISEEELAAKVREIDLRDGKLDGKRRPELITCTGCNRTISAGRAECLYCGAPVQVTSFENI